MAANTRGAQPRPVLERGQRQRPEVEPHEREQQDEAEHPARPAVVAPQRRERVTQVDEEQTRRTPATGGASSARAGPRPAGRPRRSCPDRHPAESGARHRARPPRPRRPSCLRRVRARRHVPANAGEARRPDHQHQHTVPPDPGPGSASRPAPAAQYVGRAFAMSPTQFGKLSIGTHSPPSRASSEIETAHHGLQRVRLRGVTEPDSHRRQRQSARRGPSRRSPASAAADRRDALAQRSASEDDDAERARPR